MGVRLRSLGLWLEQRAWGPPPVCRAQDVRPIPFTSAWCHPGALLVQCGPVVAVRLSCLQRTLASLLKAREMGVRLRSLGLWLEQRAWGPPPVCRAQDVRPIPFTSAWCHPGALLVQCGPVVAVRLSCLQRTLASLLKAREMGVRLRSLGLWLGQRAWGPPPVCRAQDVRPMPFTSAWCHPGALLVQCGPVVAVRLSCLQRTLASLLKAREMGVRLRSLGLWLEATGLGPTARLPSSGRATNTIHQRMVPPRRSFGSVRSRSGGAPLVPPAHARVAAQGTRDGRALALARACGLSNGPGAHRPSAELRTCDQCHSPAHGATPALFWFSAVP